MFKALSPPASPAGLLVANAALAAAPALSLPSIPANYFPFSGRVYRAIS